MRTRRVFFGISKTVYRTTPVIAMTSSPAFFVLFSADGRVAPTPPNARVFGPLFGRFGHADGLGVGRDFTALHRPFWRVCIGAPDEIHNSLLHFFMPTPRGLNPRSPPLFHHFC
jgi:hypothetical protein